MMFLFAVTIVSMLVAVTMSVVAWRVAGEERRRSEARVDRLRADIDADRVPAWQAPAPVDLDLNLSSPASAGIFAATRPAEAGSRLAVVLTVGALVFGGAVTIVLLLSGGSTHAAPARARAATDTAAARDAAAAVREASARSDAAAALPLELVALGHDRTGDKLTVRGVVRNPANGARVDRLTAVVFVFNRDGGFAGSGRATVESPTLAPGAESTFVVTVPDAGDVGRYRVSFRTEDRVVPHVDRREPALAKS